MLVTERIIFMFSAVLTWVTMSTLSAKATLPLTWSPCVCVLMMRTTGLLVSSLILARIGWPQPGFFVSTMVTPSAPTNTVVLPPPPRSMKRLSLSLSTSTTIAAGAAGCCAAWTASVSAPIAIRAPSTTSRFIRYLLLSGAEALDMNHRIVVRLHRIGIDRGARQQRHPLGPVHFEVARFNRRFLHLAVEGAGCRPQAN